MSHILQIEPDRILAETYAQALKKQGHVVVTCASAQAAIMAADKQCPDLVILELQLIEHSGIEFLYEFRSYRDWQDTPILLHTNVPASEFAEQWQILSHELDVQTYLYKPLTTLAELVRAVRELTMSKADAQATASLAEPKRGVPSPNS